MKIVVAYDGTDGAKRAAHAGVPIARASNAALLLVHVLDPRADLAEFQGSHEEALAEATRQAEEAARAFAGELGTDGGAVEVRVGTTQRGEDTGEALARIAKEEGAELIAIATRRAGGLSGFFLGSVTQQLIHAAECPVMVVRI